MLGGLVVSATADAPFVIKLLGLDALGGPGPVANFDTLRDHAWLIASADSIIGFDQGLFVIDGDGFVLDNPVPPYGVFAIHQSASEIVLTYSVPEPSGAAGVALVLALLTGRGRMTTRKHRSLIGDGCRPGPFRLTDHDGAVNVPRSASATPRVPG